MGDVTHMKWWGWGVPEHSFSPDNKPGLAPFIRKAMGVDLSAPGVAHPEFESLTIPASILPDPLRAALRDAVGDQHVSTDDLQRLLHTFGKSMRDLIHLRRNELGRVPDVVVYPGSEADVVAVTKAVADHGAVLIPFGGGTNIVGSLAPQHDEARPIVSVDTGRLTDVLDIDADSGLARIQAGVRGPDMEAQLNAQGWTLGHFPDSFSHSTLGGWIATRASGMQSDKYGNMADLTRGLRVVLPDGELVVLHAAPTTSSGPSVKEMILGSEGRLGVIVEATVDVHRIPEVREFQAYCFPSYATGVEAMRDVSESEAVPTITRVSDAAETALLLATGKRTAGLRKWVTAGITQYLMRKGWQQDEMCLCFIGYEGSPERIRFEKTAVNKIVKRNGGVGVGTGLASMFDQKQFDTPYFRDFLLDRGIVGDVSATACPWSTVLDLHDRVIETFHSTLDDLGLTGYISCHLSHIYHSGACQSFTFVIATADTDTLASYDAAKHAIQQAFSDLSATASHHHGVGAEHSARLAGDLSAGGVRLQRALFDAVDPSHRANPGKIVHDTLTPHSTEAP